MRILIVEDHLPTQRETARLIKQGLDPGEVNEAASGEEGIECFRALRPDVVVMDIGLPGMNGLDATRAIVAIDPEACILILSNYTGRNLVQAALSCGARGYVCKDRAYEELVPAIREVTTGNEYIGELTAD